MSTATLEIPFDLDARMEPVKGRVTLADGMVRVFGGEAVLLELSSGSVEELTIQGEVGSGLLYAKMKPGEGDDTVLCRFTMAQMPATGEFVKAANYYLQTNQLTGIDQKNAGFCPKCGRSYLEGVSVCLFCYNRKAVFFRVAKMAKPFGLALLLPCLGIFINDLLYFTIPVINRRLIDQYLAPGVGTLRDIILLCALMLIVRTVSIGLFVGCVRVFNAACCRFANHLRNVAFERVQRMTISGLGKRTSGEVMRRIMQDTSGIQVFLTDQGRWVTQQVLNMVVIGVILFVTNPLLAAVVFAPLPFVAAAVFLFWRNMELRFNRQWHKYSRTNSILHDIIKGIRVVKAFGNEEREVQKFSAACHDLAKVSSENEKLWAKLFPVLGFVVGAGEFLVLYFGGQAILGHTFSMGELVQFTMFAGFIYGPLRYVVSLPRAVAEALTSMVKIFEIIDEEQDVPATTEAIAAPIEGYVSLDNITFGYKAYEPVLKGVSLDIRPGEMIGIVGKSGVGKSTLINLVLRLYDVNNGKVLIDGQDIRHYDIGHLHRQIGVVFQETFLFMGSILENIAYAKEGATEEEIIAAAKVANAHDFVMKLPDGYHTLVGENGYSLSGGERQRIAIARAVLKNPSILILDEATSALDTNTELRIQKAFERLAKGRTTLVIAHRLSTIKNADEIVVIGEEGILEQGTHHQLLEQQAIYAQLYNVQFQWMENA